MPYLPLGDARLHYQEHGRGDPLLLVHGYTGAGEFLLAHDAPAAHRYRLDIAALKAASTRIVPAGGRNREFWIHRCARALADRLGTEMVEFPGGHNGYALHPKGFAARLRDIPDHRAGG